VLLTVQLVGMLLQPTVAQLLQPLAVQQQQQDGWVECRLTSLLDLLQPQDTTAPTPHSQPGRAPQQL
jgi:hypothetical protein